MAAKKKATKASVRSAEKGAELTLTHSPSHASRARARTFELSPVRDVIDAICADIAAGMPRATAAARHGVSEEALRGRANEDAEIAAKVARASAQAEAADIARLDALIDEGKPTAGQTWKMERLYRKTWNIPAMVQSESVVTVSAAPASAEALRRAAEVAEQRERLEREAAERRGT